MEDRAEDTMTFGERPGGLTARAGWTWDEEREAAADAADEPPAEAGE